MAVPGRAGRALEGHVLSQTVATVLALAPRVIAVAFLAFVAFGTMALSVARVRRDDLGDGIPGDVPQLAVSAGVIIVLMMAALGVAGADELFKNPAAAVAISLVIPLSLSPWLLYRKAIRTKGGAEPSTEVSGGEEA